MRRLKPMTITLLGAAGDVTGSAYWIEEGGDALLVDFGLFQGVKMAEDRNRLLRGLNVGRLRAVVLTHAHLDHTGRLPLLVEGGYQGPIYATPATRELTELILHDSARIQISDLDRVNRKRQRQAKPALEPLYTPEHVSTVLSLFRALDYEQVEEVLPGIEVRLVEAGHMLGSATVELTVRRGVPPRVLVFSGDLGPWGAPIIRDPVPIERADVVFLESTYGDRDHRPLAETIAEFKEILRAAVEQKGKILVPTFAVGRAQVIMYVLAGMVHDGSLPKFPAFLDSPMALEATRIYSRHPELYDEEMLELLKTRHKGPCLQTVTPSVTADDSRALNDQAGPCLIMAGAGMCNAGRILHHLKQNLWRPETWVVIVGYQGPGSLGRQLVDGKKMVSVLGERVAVQAQVRTLGGFSAHAGQADLLRWFGGMAASGPRVILTHGEERGREALAAQLKQRHGIEAERPSAFEPIEV